MRRMNGWTQRVKDLTGNNCLNCGTYCHLKGQMFHKQSK